MDKGEQDKTFDFFLSGDNRPTATRIANDLSRQGFRCNNFWEQDPRVNQPLLPWLSEVHEGVNTAKWTLLCLDGQNMDFNEIVHSLNDLLMQYVPYQQCPQVILVVTNDFEERVGNSEWTRYNIFPYIPRIVIDFNNDNYLRGIHDLCSEMFGVEIPGCLAHSLVFSHFNGFWRHILPELQEKIRQSRIYGQNPKITSTKLYILLSITRDFMMPCLKDESTSARGGTIKKTEENLTWETNHAGKVRKYILPFREVTRDNQKFYCVVDIPNVLKTIYMLGGKQVNGVNVSSEMFQFFYTTHMLLNSESFFDTVNILFYNDKSNSKEDVLFEAIQKDLSLDDSSMPQNIQPHDAIIMRDDSFQLDEEEFIRTSLTQRNIKVWPGIPVWKGLEKSKWHIFVISKEDVKFISLFCYFSMLVHGNKVQTIFLLRDVNPIDLNPNFKFAFVFSMKEPAYIGKLVDAINCEPVRLEHSLPTLDVATALAWGYSVNYIILTLGADIKSPKELTNRVKTFVEKAEQDLEERCIINKFFSLCPRSCKTGSIEQDGSKGSIKLMEPLEKYQTNDGAAIMTYALDVYQYTNKETNEKRYFVCEYNTPFNCLGEMAKYKFAGVSEDNMYQQCERFVKRIPEILSCTDVKRKFGDYSELVELIYFDDREKTLLDVMKEKLWEEGLPIIQSDELL